MKHDVKTFFFWDRSFNFAAFLNARIETQILHYWCWMT